MKCYCTYMGNIVFILLVESIAARSLLLMLVKI